MSMTKNATYTTCSLAALLLSVGAAHADMKDDQKVVQDRYGNEVRSQLFNTCVRTEWETANNTDPCAVEVPVARAPEPSPARLLKKEDLTLTFDFDEAELTDDAKAKLNRMASSFQQSSDVKRANIVGFADRIGSGDYNEQLSERRAANVQEYLTARGYLNTRVTETRGLGESRSVTRCQDESSRAALIECLRPDRRVEVEVQFTKPTQTSYRTPNFETQHKGD